MGRLATSRLMVWALIGLYVCASLAAVPVPRLAGVGEDRPSGCACSDGSGCCEGGSCCCGLVHDEPASQDDGPALLLGCEAKVKWYLATVLVFAGDAGVVGAMEFGSSLVPVVRESVLISRVLDVPSPPPRAIAV